MEAHCESLHTCTGVKLHCESLHTCTGVKLLPSRLKKGLLVLFGGRDAVPAPADVDKTAACIFQVGLFPARISSEVKLPRPMLYLLSLFFVYWMFTCRSTPQFCHLCMRAPGMVAGLFNVMAVHAAWNRTSPLSDQGRTRQEGRMILWPVLVFPCHTCISHHQERKECCIHQPLSLLILQP